ncbi:hypothetical protein [Paenibacillus sp. FSL R7-0179]|uniref:hypothetical protein n=1 Tax=Paenibacillus sp. FSL R7-0179 TaxID=2921672 RepID=UPI0030F6655C
MGTVIGDGSRNRASGAAPQQTYGLSILPTHPSPSQATGACRKQLEKRILFRRFLKNIGQQVVFVHLFQLLFATLEDMCELSVVSPTVVQTEGLRSTDKCTKSTYFALQ